MSLRATEQISRLFGRFVPEVESGLVEIKAAARLPGTGTKVAVLSHDPQVGAVEACHRHLSEICKELGGERTQVFRWSDSPEELIRYAVPLGGLGTITLDDARRMADVALTMDEFAVVARVGNPELASQLCGWEITLRSFPSGQATPRPPGKDMGSR